MVNANPLRLPGPWDDGYVLERQHTLSSDFIGHDSYGHPQFDTKRSELGELVYRLKNRNDKAVVDLIATAAVEFLASWKPGVEVIVPVPPSRQRPAYQPVLEIARAMGASLNIPVADTAIRKVKETPELKDVYDYRQRSKLLQDVFEVQGEQILGRRVLVVDDLYRSGATAATVAQVLRSAGAIAVFFLAITKTRTRT